MTARRPKDIGTAAETAVVRYLRTAGWPHAERRALRGVQDAGDITGTPGLAWSIKAGQYARDPSDKQIQEWLSEADKQHVAAGAAWFTLVTRRAGTAAAGRWWAWMPFDMFILLTGGPRTPWPDCPSAAVRMHLETACALLRYAGYGSEATNG